MKFRSPTDEDMQVALTNGHVAIVPAATEENPQGIELHPRFVREAMSLGCLAEGQVALPPEAKSETRADVITKGLRAMMAGSEADDFTKQGLPNLTSLQRRVGFKLMREEVEKIWETVRAEAG